MGDGDDGSAPSRRGGALDLDRGWVPLALLIAAVCLPILLAVLDAARDQWYPAADAATIVNRSYDMWFSGRPLVGQFSLAGSTGTDQVFSPGPLLYVVLAPAARFGPAWTLPATMGLLASAGFGLALYAARRIGGWWFAVLVAFGLVGTIRASDASTFVEVWNPWAGLAPFAALVFVSWLIALGNRRWLPVAVVLASFLVQAHLTYLPPSLVLLAIALVAGWWPGVPETEEDDRSADPAGRMRPLVAALLAGLVCWSLPLYQQFTNDPGNLTLVREAASAENEAFGSSVAVNVWWRAVGVPPAFARAASTQVAELDQLRVDATAADWVGTVVVFLLLLALGVVAWRRRTREVVVGVGLALGLGIAALAVAARLPLDRLIVAPYSLRWVVTAGLVPWLVAGLAVLRFGLLRRWAPTDRLRSGAAIGCVVLVGLGTVLVSRTDDAAWMSDPARIAGEDLVAATSPGDRIRLADSGRYEIVMTPALAWSLREHDRTPVMIRNFRVGTGERYAKDGSRCDGIVSVREASEPAPDGSREISRVPYDQPGEPQELVIYLAPDESADGLC